MNNSLVLFFILQIVDIVSTWIFLGMGVQEANPIVRFFMGWTTPVLGLILVKLAAFAFGVIWFWRGKNLFLVNLFFSALVIWNGCAIFISMR